MASKPTQDGRDGILTTPLGKDELLLERFDGVEALSELFEYRVEALSLNHEIDFDKAIGQQCSVKIKTYDGEEREFHGILVEAEWLGTKEQIFSSYRIVLRPWLWLLSHTTDYRIFEGKKAPDIIEEVFRDRGFTDFESEIKERGSFPTLEYYVQYRETDFHFVSRLMEEEGIYYFFKHEGGKHTLVLANMKSSHHPVPKHSNIPYRPPVGSFHPKEQRIERWVATRRFRSGKFTLNDYNYEKPSVQMLSEAKGSSRYSHPDMEIYTYPGEYADKEVGERYAKIELEAEQAQDHRRQGSGVAVSLFAGGLVTLTDHPVKKENTEYLIVRAVHSFGEQTYRSAGGGEKDGVEYNGHYEFLPADKPYRAPMVTTKPRIYGVQTAVVVDKQARGRVEKSPEEIEVEKLTEIYVQFYWDRRQHKEKRSCKLRVAQVWAGKNWGGQFIPRIGMEVVVEFLEGDPNRPLVVGCVYNEDKPPPYDLPGKKTISGIKSDSTKGGNGYNSWNFEDKKGGEQINVHAEKDLNVDVLHDETRNINNDLTTTIYHKESRTVGTIFTPPKGSASRETTIVMGDDNLSIMMGDHNILIPMGSQSTMAMMSIKLMVGPTMVTLTPASISMMSPTIDLLAMAQISLTAPVINITGVVNLTGMLNITGGITVNTMVPVLVPA